MASALPIALTGGIASGKSEVTRRFEQHGIAVLDADVIARELVEPGQDALAEIAQRFGPTMLDAVGRLDRRRLRTVVFADAHARRDLEAILHPRVRAALQAGASCATGPYVVLAIPLLVESRTPGMEEVPQRVGNAPGGHYDWIQYVLVVDVPPAVQLDRVMRRDGVERDAALATIAAQASRTARLALATDVIVNDGPLAALDPTVARLHSLCLQRAQTARPAAPTAT